MRKLLTSLISCSRASRRRRGGNQAAHPTAQRHSAGREERKSSINARASGIRPDELCREPKQARASGLLPGGLGSY